LKIKGLFGVGEKFKLREGKMEDPNTHVKEYIQYYCSLKEPGYALLINGKWGIGKTQLVKRILEAMKGGITTDKPKLKYLFVSLYGMRSASEIGDELYTQLHPVLSSKGMAIASKVAKGLLKASLKIDLESGSSVTATPIIPEIELPEYLRNTEGFVLVFDDLERSEIPINESLGYINSFVELQGYNAIIIANEVEISDQTAYQKIAEKLIGKKFEVVSHVNLIFDDFCGEINDPEKRRIFSLNKELIIDNFKKSGFDNLRSLKRFMLDFQRFHLMLPERAAKNDKFVCDIMKSFMIYSFEIAGGTIKPSDIGELWLQEIRMYSGLTDKETSLYNTLKEKYKEFAGRPAIFSPDLWIDLFVKGKVEASDMEDGIANSKYFIGESLPSWLHLWYLSSLDDENFDGHLQDVEKKFNSGSYSDLIDVIHVLGVFLTLIENDLYMKPKKEALLCAMQNLMRIKSSGGLDQYCNAKAMGIKFKTTDVLGKYGISSFQDSHMQEFLMNVDNQRIIRFEELEASKALNLLNCVRDDPYEFCRLITCDEGDSGFLDIPILHLLDVDKFSNEFMSLPQAARTDMANAIAYRYRDRYYRDRLTQELEWLRSLKILLNQECQQRKGKPSGYNLRKNTLTKIEDMIASFEADSVQQSIL
jgi:hypothetical protein